MGAVARPFERTPMTSSTRIDGDPSEDSHSSTWTWLLPVLTFLLGCLLGGVVIGVGATGGTPEQVAAPETTSAPEEPADEDGAGTDVSPTPDAEEDTVVRVPESCLAAADGAVVASNRIDDVVAAVRDFDARRLQEVVDEIQQQQPQVRELAERCRSTAGERLEDAERQTTPEPTPSASP